MRIIFILQNAAKGLARGSRTNGGCVPIPHLPGGLAAVLLGTGHALIPRPAVGRSDTERGIRELSDGDDCEKFEHSGLLSRRKLPWKEKEANPTREGSGTASLPWLAEGWDRLCAPCSSCYSLRFCHLELQGIPGARELAELHDDKSHRSASTCDASFQSLSFF